jgi:hypothetical protein
MSEWNRLVKSTFKMGKAKNPEYSLRDAMLEAKKMYKKGKSYTEDSVKTVTERIVRKKRRVRKTQKRGRTQKRRRTNRNNDEEKK